MIDSFVILLAVVVGYMLRVLIPKKVKDKLGGIKKITALKGSGEIIEYKPPISKEKDAEKKARKNMGL